MRHFCIKGLVSIRWLSYGRLLWVSIGYTARYQFAIMRPGFWWICRSCWLIGPFHFYRSNR